MNLGGYSARGPRDTNEDAFYLRAFPDGDAPAGDIGGFALVTDGMGGYRDGDVASDLAVASAQRSLDRLLAADRGKSDAFDAALTLTEIARDAHEAIAAASAARGTAGMGATFVGAFVSPTHAWIGHVGDARAYVVRDGVATRLTEDHSQVGRLLARGVITEQEAQRHPARNRIDRALGLTDGDVQIDELDLRPADVLLLCSDGVHAALGAGALACCLAQADDATEAAERVVRQALASGTDDNATAVVVCTEGAAGRPPRRGTLGVSAADAAAQETCPVAAPGSAELPDALPARLALGVRPVPVARHRREGVQRASRRRAEGMQVLSWAKVVLPLLLAGLLAAVMLVLHAAAAG